MRYENAAHELARLLRMVLITDGGDESLNEYWMSKYHGACNFCMAFTGHWPTVLYVGDDSYIVEIGDYSAEVRIGEKI